MHHRTTWHIITPVALIAALGVAAPATAATTDPAPTIRQEGDAFYTEEQIDDVWRSITARFPEELPTGASFPDQAPAFFHPNDTGRVLFQTGLPHVIAAQYWRCAWLSAEIAATASHEPGTIHNAQRQLDKFWSLPRVAQSINKTDYQQMVAAETELTGTPSASAEYTLQCAELFTPTQNTELPPKQDRDTQASAFEILEQAPVGASQLAGDTIYWDTARINAQGRNAIRYQWLGNDKGGGGMTLHITTVNNTILGSVTPVNSNWNTLYNNYAGLPYFPNGSFFLATRITGACGGAGCGEIRWAGTLQWNLPY